MGFLEEFHFINSREKSSNIFKNIKYKTQGCPFDLHTQPHELRVLYIYLKKLKAPFP